MPTFFIDRPIFAWVISIIIMLPGAPAILKLPVAPYPTIAPPAVTISAPSPGPASHTAPAPGPP
ncbi:efflux RND transporter permease subunit, partial [Salmonella enterica]|uniref:efflux RND transporter permease subunit n=1 Tax=Salmonella enterica TaxID=28901 RepID=UPI00398C72F0